jgi:hypothetical protein
MLTEKNLEELLERTREALKIFESVAPEAGIKTEIAYEKIKV